MANIARLGVALGLNSAEFVTGLEAASRKLDHFVTAAVGVAKNAVLALGAALSVATYKAVGYADQIADTAAANDLAIDSVIKLTNALENSGGKGDNAVKMLSSFSDFVDKAAKGSFEGQKTFSQLVISLKDIGSMSTQDLLLKTANAIAGIADPLTRSARAADVFNKSAKGVDMVDFAKGLKDGKGATLEQEQAIKDAAQAFDLFKSVGRDISLLITETLGPALLQLGKYLKDLDISNLSFTIFGKFIGFGTANDPTVQILAIGREIEELEKTKKIAIENGRTENIYIDKKIIALQKERDALIEIQRVKADAISDKKPDGSSKREVKIPKEVLAKEFELEKLRLENKLSMNLAFGGGNNSSLNEQQKIEAEYIKKYEMAALETKQKNITEEYKFKNQNAEMFKLNEIKLLKEFEEKKLQLKFKNMAEEAKQEIATVDETNKETSALDTLYSEGRTSIKNKQEADNIALDRARQMFLLDQKGLYLKAEDLQQEKEILQQQFNHIDAMEAIQTQANLNEKDKVIAREAEIKFNEQALENIRERGRILRSQKDGGLIEGFLFKMDTFGKNMETSFQAGGKAFDSLMSSMSSGLEEFVRKGELDFKKFAKSIIQDMLAIQLRASANNLFAMIGKSLFSSSVSLTEPMSGARADGGPVESGGAYMVGERGPELFVPRSAGAIVPNHSMAMMGGSTNITNYNIQAIDTKSFEDRILGSSKAVWAANAYGAKNLSLGRGRT